MKLVISVSWNIVSHEGNAKYCIIMIKTVLYKRIYGGDSLKLEFKE